MKKADFQKTISQIRPAGAKWPKAMMTASQEAKNTATVNCGGEFRPGARGREMAEAVLADPRFQEFLVRNEATAFIESAPYDATQVRINW